jgi:hypothetical protein
VFENTVLRKIFGLRTDEVTGDWRRLHAQWGTLWSVRPIKYYPSDQITKMRRTGHVARMVGRRGTYGVLLGKPEGKRTMCT